LSQPRFFQKLYISYSYFYRIFYIFSSFFFHFLFHKPPDRKFMLQISGLVLGEKTNSYIFFCKMFLSYIFLSKIIWKADRKENEREKLKVSSYFQPCIVGGKYLIERMSCGKGLRKLLRRKVPM
jgi:hypothetical protein